MPRPRWAKRERGRPARKAGWKPAVQSIPSSHVNETISLYYSVVIFGGTRPTKPSEDGLHHVRYPGASRA